MKPLYYKIYLLLLFTISGNYQLQAQSCKEDIKQKLQDPAIETLYAKTFHSLLDRMDHTNGYLPESLTGAYIGMYPRTTGAFVFLLMETGHYDLAELNLRYVLESVKANGLERIPHVLEKGMRIHSDEHQIDGQAHVILGWARLALARGVTAFEEETWPIVSKLTTRTCDRTFFPSGSWSIEPGLIRNIAFEHSRDFRRWDVWDLLTQCFVGAALTDMIKVAARHNSPQLIADWTQKRQILSEGINKHLVVQRDGLPTYAEMMLPNGNGGDTYHGMGWVTLSPIAAGWCTDTAIVRNTVAYMNRHFLQTTNGIRWMPTDIYPDGSFINEVIGKGIGWELDFARTENDFKRVLEILELIKASNAGKDIYMEFAWLEGDGYKHNDRITKEDALKMKDMKWTSRDAGNGEQSSWWCWAMARLRKAVGLPARPIQME